MSSLSCDPFLHFADCSVGLQCVSSPNATCVTVSDGSAFSSSDLETKSPSTSLPAATLLPSTDTVSMPGSDSVDDFTEGGVLGDELDSILDSIAEGSQYPLVRVDFLDLSVLCSVTTLGSSFTPYNLLFLGKRGFQVYVVHCFSLRYINLRKDPCWLINEIVEGIRPAMWHCLFLQMFSCMCTVLYCMPISFSTLFCLFELGFFVWL